MKLYAERPWRLTKQIIADLVLVSWSIVWVTAALTVYNVVQKLAVPGQKLEGGGTSLADNLSDMSGKAGGIPVVGSQLAKPLGSAAEAARGIAEAGQSQQEAVGDLATIMAWLTAGLPILLALMIWFPLRWVWIKTATTAAKLRTRPGGSELLALRALSQASLRRLAKLDDSVAAGWRSGDPHSIQQLADLELRRLGLRSRRVSRAV